MVRIDIPLGELVLGAYVTNHVDAHFSQTQSVTLRRVLNGLSVKPTRLADGRFVQSPADAVRWLLERIGDASTDGAIKELGDHV